MTGLAVPAGRGSAVVPVLVVVAVAFVAGVGPLAPVAVVPVAAWIARRRGPPVLGPAAVGAAAATVVGQLVLDAGLVPSLVDAPEAHVVAAVALAAMLGALAALGAALTDGAERAAAAEGVLALAASVARPASRDEAAARLADAMRRLVRADRTAVLLADGPHRPWTVVATSGAPSTVGDDALAEVAADPTPRAVPAAGGVACLAPVVVRGQVVGVLVAERPEGGRAPAFPPRLMARLGRLAEQAAVALESASLAEQERAVTERLLEADRHKSEFLAMITHELRTPLAVVTGAARTLQWRGDDLDAATREALVESMVRRSDQLSRLVEDLLQASGDVSLDLAPVDLAAVARMAVSDLATLEPATAAAYAGAHEVIVLADAHRLRQVVDNLLSNASRHAKGVDVAVRVTADGHWATVEVADHGPGLGEAERRRAFEPFFQADSSDRRRQGGLGLGLHICRRIVEAHGGRIWMEPGDPAGLRVLFRLPVAGPGARPA